MSCAGLSVYIIRCCVAGKTIASALGSVVCLLAHTSNLVLLCLQHPKHDIISNVFGRVSENHIANGQVNFGKGNCHPCDTYMQPDFTFILTQIISELFIIHPLSVKIIILYLVNATMTKILNLINSKQKHLFKLTGK